jgi:hypothetical protein
MPDLSICVPERYPCAITATQQPRVQSAEWIYTRVWQRSLELICLNLFQTKHRNTEWRNILIGPYWDSYLKYSKRLPFKKTHCPNCSEELACSPKKAACYRTWGLSIAKFLPSKPRYSPGCALVSSTTRLQASRFLALSLHPLTPIFLRSMDTSSSHLFLVFLFVLSHIAFHTASFLELRWLAFFLHDQAIEFFDI